MPQPFVTPAMPLPARPMPAPPMPATHPYASFLSKVRKPAQYVGGEPGQQRTDWHTADCRICLAFPDLYEIGMSHLGYKILYSLINRHPRLLAERAYAPWGDMEAELRAHEEPLRSLESWHALRDFDVVGFSLQFELTFTNVLLMLELGGIPRQSAARGEDDPLIVVGGPCATHAEVLAPFVDVMLIGDGEEKTPELMLSWAALKQTGMPRRERLSALAKLGGLYVPSLYPAHRSEETGLTVVDPPKDPALPYPIERAFVAKLDDHPFPHDGPVAATETIFDRVSVEIARGCTEGCRFCQAGMIYRPVRERSPRAILDSLGRAVREGGYDEASLTSLSTADYSAITPLVQRAVAELRPEKISLSVSSLRAYGLDEKVLDAMQQGRAAGLTFAPEAGSQRMRDVVNKNVTEAQLLETAERVFSRGWSKMKLYFMVGLPTEQDDDVRAIIDVGAAALKVGHRLQGRGRVRVTVSVSTHVPKPHTPFQWCAMDTRGQIRDKQALLRQQVRAHRGLKLRMHASEGSWLEGVLARGDRPLSAVLEHAYENGARFDSWDECLRLDAWQAAFEAHGIEPADYLGTLPIDARLPWDHIDVGLEDGFLAREYQKALKHRLSPPCGKVAGQCVHPSDIEAATEDNRRLVCYDCGIACDLRQMRAERLVFLRSLQSPEPAETPHRAAESEAVAPAAHHADGAAPASGEHGPVPSQIGDEPGSQSTIGDVVPAPSATPPTPWRLRLAYSKLGPAAYQGHLDMVRLLPRVLRRAGWSVAYTRGFRPKADLVFGPALAVGIASCNEYVDIKLDALPAGDSAAWLAALNAVSFDGVHFCAARRLQTEDAPLGRVIHAARYRAAVPQKWLAQALRLETPEALEAHLQAKLSGPLMVERDFKGLVRRIDVHHYLRQAAVARNVDWRGDFQLIGDFIGLDFETVMDERGTLRPGEALRALLGTADWQAQLWRTALLCRAAGAEGASPMQLALLRTAVRRKGPVPRACDPSPSLQAAS
ncbi:MAG: TIGR03960 family B12-binding radical SAM protein [Polyangiales bacterium]